MKTYSIKNLLVAAVTMAAMCLPLPANAQFGGLINKAKQKAEKVIDKKKDNVEKQAKQKANEAKQQAYETQRPELPWPMAKGGTYNGKNVDDFLHNIVDVPEAELKTLREQMDARFLSNAKILKAAESGQSVDFSLKTSAKEENERWWDFYGCIQNITGMGLQGVEIKDSDGSIHLQNATYLVTGRAGGGIGYYVENHGGKFKFCSLGHQATFLNSEDLAKAKEAARRTRMFQILTKDLHPMWDEAGEKYTYKDRYMYNFEGLYSNALERAIEENSPENIEFRSMPKAGAMHAKLKAQALAIAKERSKNVIDVVITSNDWDVKMKGLVPSHRTVYGYYVIKDEQGKICTSRAWTQSYQGNGKYGKLRAGGVGVEADFYVK